MTDAVGQHINRLRVVDAAMLASVAVYGAVVHLSLRPSSPPLSQGEHFLWIFAAISVLNLVSIMPVYRAMLSGPRRVFAAGRQVEVLLSAHFSAHVVALARLEAVALFGLALFFLTGRVDWFWIFAGIAAVGLIFLWPQHAKVDALIGEAARGSATGL
ncbi:MAG: hypothetical protein ACM3O7_08060 [Acidobacteriota bacterium]